MQYQNKPVTVIRDAKAGDQGFDADKGAQSFIRLENGNETSVAKSDLKA